MADIRAKAVYFAKLAEQTERYDDMVEKMKEVLKMGVELSEDERIMLSVGYHKLIRSRRGSVRKLISKVMEEASTLEPVLELSVVDQKYENIGLSEEYYKKVEREIVNICTEILCIIDKNLIPSCKPGDAISTVFYLKMKGDFYRYVAKIGDDVDKKKASNESSKAYQAAIFIAKRKLPPAHPTRLGLALNFAVLCEDVFCCVESSCEIAKQAYEEAESGLGSLNEQELKDSTKILQLFKDNMVLWEAELAQDCIANAYSASI